LSVEAECALRSPQQLSKTERFPTSNFPMKDTRDDPTPRGT